MIEFEDSESGIVALPKKILKCCLRLCVDA